MTGPSEAGLRPLRASVRRVLLFLEAVGSANLFWFPPLAPLFTDEELALLDRLDRELGATPPTP